MKKESTVVMIKGHFEGQFEHRDWYSIYYGHINIDAIDWEDINDWLADTLPTNASYAVETFIDVPVCLLDEWDNLRDDFNWEKEQEALAKVFNKIFK